MLISRILRLILTIFLIVACVKSPEKIDDARVVNTQSQQGCSDVNLATDLFLHKNTLNLFDCVGWGKEFPALRKAISKIDEGNWNQLLIPLNHLFFRGAQEREALAQKLKEMDERDQFSSISNFSQMALSKTSFSIASTYLEPQSNKDFWKINQDEIQTISSFTRLSQSKEHDEMVLPFYQKISSEKIEEELDFLATLGKRDVGEGGWELTAFLQSLLFKKGSESPYFLELIKRESSPSKKAKIISLSSERKILNIVKGVHEISKKRLECQVGQNGITIDVSLKMKEIVSDLRKGNWGEFVTTSIDKLYQAFFAIDLCPSIKIYFENNGETIETSAPEIVSLFKDPWSYDVISHHSKSLEAMGGNELDYFRSLRGELSNTFSKLIKRYEQNYPAEFYSFLDYMSSLDVGDYLDLANAMVFVVDGRNSIIKNLPRMSQSELEHILNILHFALANTSVTEFSRFLVEKTFIERDFIVNHLWGSQEREQKTLTAINFLLREFSKDDVLQEIPRFLSRERFFVLAKILSLSSTTTVKTIKLGQKENAKEATSGLSKVSKGAECLFNLAERGFDLSSHEKGEIPASCQVVRSATTSILEKFTSLNGIFKNLYSNDLFSHLGFWNKEIRVELLALFKNLQNDGVFTGFWKETGEELKKSETKSLLSKVVTHLRHLLSYQKDVLENLAIVAVDSVIFKESSYLLSNFLQTLSNNKIASVTYTPFELPFCFKWHNDFTCSSKDVFISKADGAVKILQDPARPERPYNLAKVMGEAISGKTLQDFATKEKFYSIPLGPLALMLYDLSNTNDKRNQKKIELNIASERGTWKKKIFELTILQQIEKIISSVAFDNNYLGAHFQNAMAKSAKYRDVVAAKKSLLSMCRKISYCGKMLGKDERAMAENAVATFDGLLEADLYFGHGELLRSIMGMIVHASADKSRSDLLSNKPILGVHVPWVLSDEELKWHQGVLLSRLSEINFFSTIGFWLNKRFATRGLLEDFLKSTKGQEIVRGLELLFIKENFREPLLELLVTLLSDTKHKERLARIISELSPEELYGLMSTMLVINSDLTKLNSIKSVFRRIPALLPLFDPQVESGNQALFIRNLSMAGDALLSKELLQSFNQLLEYYDSRYGQEAPLDFLAKFYQESESKKEVLDIVNMVTKIFNEGLLTRRKEIKKALLSISKHIQVENTVNNPVHAEIVRSLKSGDLINYVAFFEENNRGVEFLEWLFVKDGELLSEFVGKSIQGIEIIKISPK